MATYTAALGFDGVNAASTLTFSSLSSPTIAGLLTDTFNSLDSQLPPSLQQNLTLDLAHNSILFAYPTTAANPYVVGGTTDFGAGSKSGLRACDSPGAGERRSARARINLCFRLPTPPPLGRLALRLSAEGTDLDCLLTARS